MDIRTHTCGELRLSNSGESVVLNGWVNSVRLHGQVVFVDLRDRYGKTQVVFNADDLRSDFDQIKKLSMEDVLSVSGKVQDREKSLVNSEIATGEIEVYATSVDVLNFAEPLPFTISDRDSAEEDLRLKYRYLELRTHELQNNLYIRHLAYQSVRNYLSENNFLEIETPVLMKSTPEGARDYLVPSRIHQGKFYALPQSPQVYKQILMIAGYDKYFQIVKCFRDEDLRADRQPEFTQIDCEMAFVEQKDILSTFEGLVKHLFKTVLGISFENSFPVISYDDAMSSYGSDKPDLRFDMKFNYIKDLTTDKGFRVFDDAECVIAIKATGAANYSRKQLDNLTNWVKRPQIGAKGLAYVKFNEDGTTKSSIDKFYDPETLQQWGERCQCSPGDLLLILSGKTTHTQHQMNELRLKMSKELGLIKEGDFKPVWVVDFPLFELDEETNELHAMHHPFTSPKNEDIHLLENTPEKVKANAYDLAINGVEVGGGSIRIHDRLLQEKIFKNLGFTNEEAYEQFGFLLNAFEYGAPPHGGIAFGFDRLCALFGGQDSIRDFIAFPKNNSGRDTMLDAPSKLDNTQLKELGINLID